MMGFEELRLEKAAQTNLFSQVKKANWGKFSHTPRLLERGKGMEVESITKCRISLVAQWLRIRLPMQGARV